MIIIKKIKKRSSVIQNSLSHDFECSMRWDTRVQYVLSVRNNNNNNKHILCERSTILNVRMNQSSEKIQYRRCEIMNEKSWSSLSRLNNAHFECLDDFFGKFEAIIFLPADEKDG